jgi:phosphatidylglycerophosphate synthase
MSDIQHKQARKAGGWFFKVFEKKLTAALIPFVPSWIQTDHLTWCTVGWMVLAVTGGYLAQFNFLWLWLASIAVAGQYITDLLDGAIGRHRNTGLVKWGFYVDHFLDFCFFCSILAGYWFITQVAYQFVLFIALGLGGVYFAHTILKFGATGKFEIATMGIGPTESRLVFVLVNSSIAFFDKIVFSQLLVVFFVLTSLGIVLSFWRTQQQLRELDLSR